MPQNLRNSLPASTAKAQNIAFFSTALTTIAAEEGLSPSRWLVVISATAVNLQITLDNGVTWTNLSAGLTANTYTEFKLNIASTDNVNFRTTNVAGITVDYFRVYEMIGQTSY